MKNYLRFKVFFTVLILLVFVIHSALANDKKIFAFKNVNVIPMKKEVVLYDFTVIIEDNKITKIGPTKSIEIPENAKVIDGTSKFMIPALADMHVHLEGDAWNIMYPPNAKFTQDEINFEDILFQYIANGITTVDVMFAFPEHIKLREKINTGKILGPRLVLSKMIDGPGKAWPPPIGTWVNNPDEAKTAVFDAYNQGFDRIKVYSFLDKESYDTIIATSKNLEMPVDGHIPLSTTVEHVIESGQNMIAHSEEFVHFVKDFTSEQIDYFSTLLAESDTWLTSTLTTSHSLISLFENGEQELSKPGTQYLHPMGKDLWNYIYNNLYKPIPEENQNAIINAYENFQIPFTYMFYKKGGKLLAGSDALVPPNMPGYSLHSELKEFVNAGLTPFQALKISTTNTFEFLGELDQAGTIEPGKKADFVLLDRNPLEDISNTRKIVGVFTQQQWISKSEMDKRLKEIEESFSKLKEDRLEFQ